MTERTTTAAAAAKKKIRGVLIDLSGTLHIGNEAIPGAKKALRRLRSVAATKTSNNPNTGPIVRFLTNTSTKSVDQLLDQLNDDSTLGFDISPGEMITSLKATAEYVKEHNLRPLLLMEDASDFNFDENQEDEHHRPYDSVVVGLAPSRFCYQHLNAAFRVLLKHPDNLIAIHRSNYLRDSDGGLSLGPGAFVSALETASNCSPAKVMGKPSKTIFDAALKSMNRTRTKNNSSTIDNNNNNNNHTPSETIIEAEEVCMIGDDVLVDCQGALDAGIGTAILVQTGKYRPGDETKWTASEAVSSSGDEGKPRGRFLVFPSIVEAIDFVLESF